MALLTESMTNIITPPADCSTSWTYEGSYYNSVKGRLLIQNALSVNEDCFPSGFENSSDQKGNKYLARVTVQMVTLLQC
ncbi:uncharacterized protein BDV14DRAFT_163933 [Aspergillus stella-maris]|uniref:uncharacterized protein n=1 Tax=Aspergillus stella-maris TaxID=1810926 RepID=UPI003CCCF3A7